jgi:hypothetical protein
MQAYLHYLRARLIRQVLVSGAMLSIFVAMLVWTVMHPAPANVLMGFSVFSGILHYFGNFFKALVGQLKVTVEAFLKNFVQTDLGNFAVDAVAYIEATLEGATGIEKRDAAVAKFLVDAAAAGHDIASFSKSLVIFFIESALQAFESGAAKINNPEAPASKTAVAGIAAHTDPATA